MKAYIPVIVLAAGALAVSCSRQPDVPSASIEFECLGGNYTYRMLGSAKDFDRDSDIRCFDSASIVMPARVLDRDIKELRDSILSAAFDTVAPVEQAMKAYFEKNAAELGYKVETVAEGADEEARADGLLLVDGKVTYLSADWLTYCVTTAVSTPGAAHGLTTNRYLNYAIVPGKLVTLSSIFTPEGIKALPGIIARQAERLKPVLGPTTIDSLPAQGNFLITPEGTIMFAYQPYEVASYAQGEIRVPFYPYQLSDYLTPEGLALFHLDRD